MVLLPPAMYAATLCLACPPRTHPFTARWDVLLRHTFRVFLTSSHLFPLRVGACFAAAFRIDRQLVLVRLFITYMFDSFCLMFLIPLSCAILRSKCDSK